MSDISYPYLPEGRTFKYVSPEHPFMVEAEKARRECSGDPVWPIGIVLVKNGEIVARAGNGFNRGPGEPHLCPRILAMAKTGEGYDLCPLHAEEGHAERMILKEAGRLGVDPSGADLYMYGHWWCCEPCWNAMIAAGIRDEYVTDTAHEEFTKPKVYAETLKDYPEEIRRAYGV